MRDVYPLLLFPLSHIGWEDRLKLQGEGTKLSLGGGGDHAEGRFCFQVELQGRKHVFTFMLRCLFAPRPPRAKVCVIFFRAIRNDSLAEFPPGAAVLCVERDKKRQRGKSDAPGSPPHLGGGGGGGGWRGLMMWFLKLAKRCEQHSPFPRWPVVGQTSPQKYSRDSFSHAFASSTGDKL